MHQRILNLIVIVYFSTAFIGSFAINDHWGAMQTVVAFTYIWVSSNDDRENPYKLQY